MKEFKGKSLIELKNILTEKREALRTFRFEVMAGKVKNVKLGQAIKKSIAMILTEINSQKVK